MLHLSSNKKNSKLALWPIDIKSSSYCVPECWKCCCFCYRCMKSLQYFVSNRVSSLSLE